MSFIKLRQIANREGFVLVLSEIPPQVANALRAGGLLGDGETLPAVSSPYGCALEWCEDRLLAEVMTRQEARASADNWLASENRQRADVHPAGFLTSRSSKCRSGDFLIQQGDAGDSLYLLFAGRVTGCTGRPRARSCDYAAWWVTRLWVKWVCIACYPAVRPCAPTSRPWLIACRCRRWSRWRRTIPRLRMPFTNLVIRTLAARLEFANREIASLQR